MNSSPRPIDGPIRRTEQRHPAAHDLDAMTSFGILTVMNNEDKVAVDSARQAIPALARLVDVSVGQVRGGASVHYFGAGTSGRLGVLDAAELGPTFNLPRGVVVPHIAGGAKAVTEPVEGAEDSWATGCAETVDVRPGDVVIGLTASGSTRYVGGALEEARKKGAVTALIACNAAPLLEPLADHIVIADTGPEIVTGSTRLKAATAEKILLNGFSTALMIALGRTWQGLMVSVVASNKKLNERTERILAEVLETDLNDAVKKLAAADGDLKAAIVAGRAHVALDEARSLLKSSGDSVAGALQRAAERIENASTPPDNRE